MFLELAFLIDHVSVGQVVNSLSRPLVKPENKARIRQASFIPTCHAAIPSKTQRILIVLQPGYSEAFLFWWESNRWRYLGPSFL